MTNSNCLNCERELTEKFCPNCGQKSDTHRISFRNFFLHDLLHGTFHIERGMLFTAKQALLSPGKAALDYISGKRKRYYNVFYFILIAIGLNIFLGHFLSEVELTLGRELKQDPPFLNEASKKLDKILDQSKIIICLFVPFAAINARIIFRRKGLNLAEHFIISGMILLGMSLLSLIGNIIFSLNLIIEFKGTFANIYSTTFITLITGFIAYGYINAFGEDYTKLGITYRILLLFGLLILQTYLLLLLAVGIVTNWEFYTVNIVGLFG